MSIDLHWPYCVYFQLRVERNLAMLENIFFYFISYFFEFGDIKKREVSIEIKREENCSRTSYIFESSPHFTQIVFEIPPSLHF